MAQWLGKTFSITRLRFDIDGEPAVIVTNFTVNRNDAAVPLFVAGQPIAADIVPGNITVQGSLSIAWVLDYDPVTKKLIRSSAGTAEQQMASAQSFYGKNIKVWDTSAKKYVLEIVGFYPGGIGISATPVGTGNVPFVALNLLPQGDMAT